MQLDRIWPCRAGGGSCTLSARFNERPNRVAAVPEQIPPRLDHHRDIRVCSERPPSKLHRIRPRRRNRLIVNPYDYGALRSRHGLRSPPAPFIRCVRGQLTTILVKRGNVVRHGEGSLARSTRQSEQVLAIRV